MTSAVVVGSGPNGLAAALTLAAEGVEVTVLEAEDRLGGGTRSAELTVPGLIHDECAAAHPLAVDTPFSRRFDLGARGLVWREPEVQYAHPLEGGSGAAALRSVQATAAALAGRDGRRWRALFEPLSDSFSEIVEEITRPMLHVPADPLAMVRFGIPSALPVAVLARLWSGAGARALWAGVAAHAFRPFGTPVSAAVGVTLATAAHRVGWPVAEGGSASISRAMIALLREQGATLETGVRVGALEELGSPDVVMLDLAPAAAAELAGARVPARVARALRRFRRGPGAFKVDFAVQQGVPWSHEDSRRAGTVHVGGSYEEIAAAEADVARGRMPERPFVLACQQYLADPTRSRGDVHPFYTYAHVPAGFEGDISERVEAQIERFAPGFRERVLDRCVRGPRALEAHNANYTGGDIITGANTARQMLFRPRVARDPYSLGVPGVYICSAATPPGAGAHGMCGYNAALAALRRIRAQQR